MHCNKIDAKNDESNIPFPPRPTEPPALYGAPPRGGRNGRRRGRQGRRRRGRRLRRRRKVARKTAEAVAAEQAIAQSIEQDDPVQFVL